MSADSEYGEYRSQHFLRPVVADSWRRCDERAVRTALGRSAPVRMTGDILRAHRDAHPLARALQLCRDVLGDAARDTESVFALADATGLLLWVTSGSGS